MSHNFQKLVHTLRQYDGNDDLSDQDVLKRFQYVGGNFGKHLDFYNNIPIQPPLPINTGDECLCGKKNVVKFGYLQHKEKLITIAVGSSCIKRYFPDITSNVCSNVFENGLICGKPHSRISHFCLECDQQLNDRVNHVRNQIEYILGNFTGSINDDLMALRQQFAIDQYNERLLSIFNYDGVASLENLNDDNFIKHKIEEMAKHRYSHICYLRTKMTSKNITVADYLSKYYNQVKYFIAEEHTNKDIERAKKLLLLTRKHIQFCKNNPNVNF